MFFTVIWSTSLGIDIINCKVVSILPTAKDKGILKRIVGTVGFTDPLQSIISCAQNNIPLVTFVVNQEHSHVICTWCVMTTWVFCSRSFVGINNKLIIISLIIRYGFESSLKTINVRVDVVQHSL